jgi:hypothetical protein
MPSLEQQTEIESLWASERQMDAASAEADRLCRDLLPFYKCDFIVVNLPPMMSYAILEGDWRHNNGTCTPKFGRPDRGYKGAVAISLERLRALHRWQFER